MMNDECISEENMLFTVEYTQTLTQKRRTKHRKLQKTHTNKRNTQKTQEHTLGCES